MWFKRQGYGRAKVDLLRKRVLWVARPTLISADLTADPIPQSPRVRERQDVMARRLGSPHLYQIDAPFLLCE